MANLLIDDFGGLFFEFFLDALLKFELCMFLVLSSDNVLD
jgi:hypothetical protein